MIARVVACHRDPDPRVSGQGFAKLRAAGIALLVSTVIVLCIPKQYQSMARIMPPEQGSGSAAMIAALAGKALLQLCEARKRCWCQRSLVDGRQRLLELLECRAVLAGQVDIDQHLESATRRVRIDTGGVAEDHALVLETLDTTQARRRCQTHPLRELDIREATVAL